MTLKKGIIWSQRKMRPQSVRFAGKLNPIMQKVLSNKKIAKALDQPRERKEFFGMIKNLSKDGVYKGELRKLFGDLRSGKVRSRTINAKELRTIAKEFFPDSAKRYSFKESRPQKNSPAPEQNSAMFDEIRRGFSSSGGTQTESNAPRNAASFRYGKSKPAKQYPPPGSSLDYEFAKPGLVRETKTNSSDSTIEKTKSVGNYSSLDDRLKYEFEKKASSETGSASSSSEKISLNTPEKMADIMNRIRKNGEEGSKNNGNNQSSGGFSKALEAMRRSKRG